MEQFQVRTDLALEARERFEEDAEIRGVSVEEQYDEKRDIRLTKVFIESENGAKAMGKPVGVYITLEAPKLSEEDVYELCRLAILEYLTSGITANFDMYMNPRQIAQASADCGFRTVVAGALNNFTSSLEMEAT